MVASLKFNTGAKAILDALIGSHTLKAALTNTLPLATQVTFDPVVAHPPPASVGGYPTGGYTLANLSTEVYQTVKALLKAGQISVEAADGDDCGPFQHIVIYISTLPGNPVLTRIDLGEQVLVENGQPAMNLKFSGANPGAIYVQG